MTTEQSSSEGVDISTEGSGDVPKLADSDDLQNKESTTSDTTIDPPENSAVLRSHHITNPFESYLLDSLSTTVSSPGFLFKKSAREDKKESSPEGPFRWSFDQMAQLHPADIDESEAANIESPDPAVEARAHIEIEKFWSTQKYVVPSPGLSSIGTPSSASRAPQSVFWSSARARRCKLFEGSPAFKNIQENDESPVVRPGLHRVSSMQKRTKEVQTVLTFPPELDLVKLLGGRFIYDETNGTAEQAAFEANLSISSLRRKLFAEEIENSSTVSSESDSAEPDTFPHLANLNDEENEWLLCDEQEVTDEKKEFFEGDMSVCGDTLHDTTKDIRRFMASPHVSPIKKDV